MANKKSNAPKDPLKDRPKVSLKNASLAKNGQDEIIKTETYKGAPRKYNRYNVIYNEIKYLQALKLHQLLIYYNYRFYIL